MKAIEKSLPESEQDVVISKYIAIPSEMVTL